MVGRAKKIATNLARKLKKDKDADLSRGSDALTLGTIMHHIKRNWVDIKAKTLKISWPNSHLE